MSKKKSHPVKNRMLKIVREPVFRPRIVKNKKTYDRKRKHQGRDYSLDSLKLAA